MLLGAPCPHQVMSGTCSHALHYPPVSLRSLTAVSVMSPPPLRLKYQFRKPISWHYHSPDEVLLLFVVTAACPLQESAMQCYSAHSACYSVLAVLELFYVFSKVSCFMLILMNIKNKLKCENNYLIRDQNNFSFIAEIAALYVLRPGDKRPIQLRDHAHSSGSDIPITSDPWF